MQIPTFLKWAGGKRRLIKQIDQYIPRKINNYFEPFLGGGSMFFYIKQKYNPKKCILSDMNKDLIETFKLVRDNPQDLMKKLRYFKKKNSKEFFYKVRKKFNKKTYSRTTRAAAFIYLNKTCFNGLWRVNSKNEFNVPFGDYKNPGIFEKDVIMLASRLLQGVELIVQDYQKILSRVKKGDFVYLDPCYDPLKKTSFANYNPKRFNEKDRLKLFKFMNLLRLNNIHFALSNNDLPQIRDLYTPKFSLSTIWAPRSINSNSLGRGKIPELIIYNN